MCTIGAKILQRDREFVLFKNRDFTRSRFEDRIKWTGQTLGILGLETWDGDDPAKDRFSGYSIGFNAHIACCDSNVRMIPRGENYDILVQEVLDSCTTIDQAVNHIRRIVRDRIFGWANLLVVSAHEIAALEVRGNDVEVERSSGYLARANHHVRLGATPDDDDTTTTLFRYQSALNGLENVTALDDVFPLLRAHQPDSRHSVCNHGLYNTVYSYVIHWKNGDITLFVHQGHPCDDRDYVTLPVDFSGTPDLTLYPSRYVD